MKNNKFCIVIVFWEPKSKVPDTITKCISSLKTQRYTNWECILINDEANSRTITQIEQVVGGDKRFQVIYNKERKTALPNRLLGNNIICKDDEDIIVDLDGDDWLSDIYVLDYLNQVYQDENVWATYGQYKIFLHGELGHCTDSHKPFCRLDDFGDARVISHLRSYKYFLAKKLRDEDMKDNLGKYFTRAEDAVRLWPMFEMAGMHLKFLPRVNYVYNNATDYNDSKVNPIEQCAIGDIVRYQKLPYMALQNKDSDPFKKISIRLLDSNFVHTGPGGSICGFNKPNYIDWYRGADFRPFTFYTEKFFGCEPLNPDSINVAWLLEPEVIDPKAYQYIKNHYSDYDYVLTHDKSILETIPNAWFGPAASTWLKPTDFNIHPKTKNVCMMASEKRNAEGHDLRYEVVEKLASKIGPVFGTASTKFESRNIIKDFRYVIEIQNCKKDYYFTERLIDCFLTGTVPIFWGCPSIGNFFNKKGIIDFQYTSDLETKLNRIGPEDYEDRKEAIQDNFYRAHKFILADDWIYFHFIRRIQTGAYLA